MDKWIEIGMKIGMEIGMETGTGIAAVDGMMMVEISLLTAVEREDAVDLTHAMMTLAMIILALYQCSNDIAF